MNDDGQKTGVPISCVDALLECSSDLWRGYEKELNRSRDSWDREGSPPPSGKRRNEAHSLSIGSLSGNDEIFWSPDPGQAPIRGAQLAVSSEQAVGDSWKSPKTG